MNNENIRVSLAFARGTDLNVESIANTVISKLYPLPDFTDPPVPLADMKADYLAYTTALADLVNGGKLATALKNETRAKLVQNLRDLAYFVQIRCKNNLAVLLSSGFEPVSINRTRAPLPRPTVVRVDNGMTGQTILVAEANPNVRSWQAEFAPIAEDGVFGEWIAADPATDSRRIIINNQIPGRMFAYRLRGVGGSTGFSDWSNTVTHRAA